jgi:hypothetical protein
MAMNLDVVLQNGKEPMTLAVVGCGKCLRFISTRDLLFEMAGFKDEG